jgi:hypothetical protein
MLRLLLLINLQIEELIVKEYKIFKNQRLEQFQELIIT